MDPTAILAASKAVDQIRAIVEAYSPSRWPFPATAEALEHDFAVLLQHIELRRVRVLGFDGAGKQTYSYKITFRPGGTDGPGRFDSARSVELPLLPLGLIERLELTINSFPDAVRPQLRGPWGTSPLAPNVGDGEVVELEHAPKITGGRQEAQMSVDRSAMHLLEVKFDRDRYGFAWDHNLNVGGVFLHKRFTAVPDVVIRKGELLKGLVIQTARGLQGRALRPLKGL